MTQRKRSRTTAAAVPPVSTSGTAVRAVRLGNIEHPNERFATRQILDEVEYNMASFAGHPFGGWIEEFFEAQGFSSLLHPVPMMYPGVVRLFYLYLHWHLARRHFSTTIDGRQIEFTRADIAAALQFQTTEARMALPISEVRDIRYLKNALGAGSLNVRRIHLPRRMWLVDSIITNNIWPIGHFQERNGFVLRLVYSFTKAFRVDPEEYIAQMWEYIVVHIDKQDRIGRNVCLVLPRFITQLLLHKGFTFQDDEEVISTPVRVYDLTAWNTSALTLQKVCQNLHIPLNYMEEAGPPEK